MIEILFGWLTKPRYSFSFVDALIITLEFIILWLLVCLVCYLIFIIKKRRNKQ